MKEQVFCILRGALYVCVRSERDNRIHISGDGRKIVKGDMCEIHSFLVLATVDKANQNVQKQGD